MDREPPKYTEKLKPMSKWKHLKSGNIYVVIGNCFIESTCTQAVLYASDNIDADSVAWVRPLTEWKEKFEPI